MDDPVLEALNRAADEVTPVDIDNIIAYLRKQRANFEAGVKPKKETVNLVEALKIEPKRSFSKGRRF
jgi:hypothetical protein